MVIPNNKLKCLIISLCFTSILFILLWIVSPPVFETNDDTYMMFLLSGVTTGTPTAYTIFTGIVWGIMISFLYKIAPGLPWYGISFAFIIILSLSLLFFYMLIIFEKKGISFFYAAIVYLASVTFFFFFYIRVFQFNVLGAFCGVGASACAYAIDLFIDERKTIKILNYFLLNLFVILAFNMRKEMGFLVLANVLICYFISYISHRKERGIKEYLLAVSITALCTLSVFLCNYISESSPEWRDFRDYTNERATYMDYPHLPYEDNKEIYESIGWSKPMYEALNWWYMIDENYNKDALHYLNGLNSIENYSIENIQIQLQSQKMGIIQAIIWALLLAWVSFKNKKALPLWLFFLAFLAICLLFGYMARLPRRLFESVLFIYITPCILGIVNLMEKRKSNGVLGAIICALLFIVSMFPYGAINESRDFYGSYEVAIGNPQKEEMEAYAAMYKDKLFIYDYFLSQNAGYGFDTYTDNKPFNLTLWGGSTMYSPMYYKQLKQNGIESLYPDDFFSDKILFMSLDEPNERLVSYMEYRYPGSYVEQIDKTQENIIIYRFRK